MAALLSQGSMVVIVELCVEFDFCDMLHIPQFFEWDDLQPWAVYHARQEMKSLPQQLSGQTYQPRLISFVFGQWLVLIFHPSGMPRIPLSSERDNL